MSIYVKFILIRLTKLQIFFGIARKIEQTFLYLHRNCEKNARINTVKLLLLTIGLLLVAVLLLGVKVLFVKGGKFPSGHVASNPALRRRGIGCAKDMQ